MQISYHYLLTVKYILKLTPHIKDSHHAFVSYFIQNIYLKDDVQLQYLLLSQL